MGLSETNQAWHQVNFYECLGSHTSEWFESCHVSTAWNQHKSFQTSSQMGGMAILMVSKLTYQVASMGCNPTGLGWWTWTCFRSKHGHHTCIVTCYRLVKNEKGPLLVYNQPCRYFLQHNVDHCPLLQFQIDLKHDIEKWQADGNLLIIGRDWNEEVSSPPWRTFWHNLGLVNPEGLISRTPTATYNHGCKQLDMVYLSPSLHQVECEYLSCNNTILSADHSALWLNVPAFCLHLQAPPPNIAKGRWLKTESPWVHDNYLNWYKQVCVKHKLIECATALWHTVQDGQLLTVKQMIEYETLDALWTKGMNEAEKHCRKLKMGAIDWSPELALACHCIAAWSALLRTHKGITINSQLVH